MMINDNIDVHNGIANGTTAEFVAYLKQVQNLFQFKFGYWVYSVTVDEVDQLSLSGKIMTDSRAPC
jgi:hypothetical protein